MDNISITPKPLDSESFKKYGQIIKKPYEGPDRCVDSHKYWDKFLDMDLSNSPAEMGFSRALHRPFRVASLECHRKATQTFIPFSTGAGILVVASDNPKRNKNLPTPSDVNALLLDGSVGYHLFKGTWHQAIFPFGEKADYIMVVRRDTVVDDQKIVNFDPPINISLKTERKD